MEKKYSPSQALKQVLSSGMLTFICVVFTIAAAAGIGDAFANRIDLTQLSIAGFDLDLGQLLGSEIGSILGTISNVIFAITLIGLLPTVLTAVAFWLVKTGAKEGEGKIKLSLLGFNLFKIKFFYEVIMAILALILIGIIGIFVLIGSFSSGSGTAIGVVVVCLALVIGYFGIYYRYNLNFLFMLMGASNSLRTNANLLTKSGMVIGFNYVGAIFIFIGSFGNGFWGLAAGICKGLCIIFVNRLFASYDQLCGYATKEDVKAIMERVKTDPALERTALALGVARDYTPEAEQKPSIMGVMKNLMFGTSIAYIDDETPYTPAENTATAPAAATYANRSAPAQQKTYTRAADITDELTARHLALFTKNEVIADNRYQICGERAYAQSGDPVAVSWAQVVVDGISEKKILRIAFSNNAPITVKEIKFTVTPKTNESSALGIFKNVTLACAAETGSTFGAEYGLILPDNTTCGSIKVTYVEFADGMFRDKEGGEVFFSTKEKAEFDTNLYLSAMKMG